MKKKNKDAKEYENREKKYDRWNRREGIRERDANREKMKGRIKSNKDRK